MSSRTKLVLGVALALVAGVYLWWTITSGPGAVRAQGDTLVYRAGALAWMDGRPVYTDPLTLELGAGEMFFTYGPLALVIFAPLAALPVDVSFAVLAVLSWLALLAALLVWCRHLGWSRREPWVAGLGCTVLLGLTIPMQHQSLFRPGQRVPAPPGQSRPRAASYAVAARHAARAGDRHQDHASCDPPPPAPAA